MPLYYFRMSGFSHGAHGVLPHGKPLREVNSLLFELTAGCIDIVATRVTNGGFNAMHGESSLERLDLMDRRRFEKRAWGIVQLDKVDVAKRARAEVDKGIHLGGRVVDAINHSELVARATTSLFHIGLQGLMKALKSVFLNTRHEFVAR